MNSVILNNNNYSLHDAKFCGIFILLYFSIMHLLYPLLISSPVT